MEVVMIRASVWALISVEVRIRDNGNKSFC